MAGLSDWLCIWRSCRRRGPERMQRVAVADAVLVARVLTRLPERLRPWALFRMVREAEAAADRMRRSGAMHPIWGDGSLMAVAMRRPRDPEPLLDDRVFLGCLQLVLAVLDQPRAQDRQRGRAGS